MDSDIINSTSAELPGIVSGWLEKEGRQIKTWKKRWFELDTTKFTLTYYVDSKKLSQKGEFIIMGSSLVSIVEGGKKSNMFSIQTTHRTEDGNYVLMISAPTDSDRGKWIHAIKVMIEYRRHLSYRSVSAMSVLGAWMEGWLEKEGGSIKTWKKRWICLDCQPNGFVITYFEDLKKKKKKGELPITKKSVVSSLDDGFHDKKRNLFAVVSSDNAARSMFIMSAPTPTEKVQWIEAIQSAIRTYHDVHVSVLTADPASSSTEIVQSFYTLCMSMNHTAVGMPASFKNILADDFVIVGSDNQCLTKDSVLDQVRSWKTIIPDLSFTIEDLIVDDNRVVVRYVLSGSPLGSFLGIAGLDGSRRFVINAIDIHTVQDSKITRRHHVEDWSSAVNQLESDNALSSEATLPPPPPLQKAAPPLHIELSEIQKESYRYIVRPLYSDFLSSLGDKSIADTLIADSYTAITLGRTGRPVTDTKADLQEYVTSLRESIPDLRWAVQEMLVNDNRVVVRCILTGTPVGSFMGLFLDGSKRFITNSIDINVVEDGKIQSRYHVVDWVCALRQLR